jgi:tagatose-6-phosphate ketose/aldose isomerase
MIQQIDADRMLVFHHLLQLPLQQKEKLGLAATAGEIAQQPASWRGTRRIFERHAQALREFLEAVGVKNSAGPRCNVVLIGAGSSDYIGQSLALLLRSEWGCETQAVASTDMLANMSDYVVPDGRSLWISFSRSGDSPEGVAVITHALDKFPGIQHLVITCNDQGRMAGIARERDGVYAVPLEDEVNDRGLAMTSSFTNMVVFGQCLAHAWSGSTYDTTFEALVRAGESFLPVAAACAQELAAGPYKRMCVLGSGALTGIAKESALKVLEMTAGRVKTMSESVLGLRHGPMAALDVETLLVCFASSDARRQRYEGDLLREVGDKGIVAERVIVGPGGTTELAGCSEVYLAIEGALPDLYRPPVDVIFGQLLGLYFSLAHDLKPDAPSPNGVISRVVNEFRIYE